MQRFHRGMKATPYVANRALFLLSKLTKLAERRGLRPPGTNPCADEGLTVSYKVLYNEAVAEPKPVVFLGSSLDDLRGFPVGARRQAGHDLNKVQHGAAPSDWKPMNTVGRGVREIRIRDADDAFRVLYVATFSDAVHVLHCFPKKTRKTRKADLDLAAKRYRGLVKEGIS